jgi:hypothetical protein
MRLFLYTAAVLASLGNVVTAQSETSLESAKNWVVDTDKELTRIAETLAKDLPDGERGVIDEQSAEWLSDAGDSYKYLKSKFGSKIGVLHNEPYALWKKASENVKFNQDTSNWMTADEQAQKAAGDSLRVKYTLFIHAKACAQKGYGFDTSEIETLTSTLKDESDQAKLTKDQRDKIWVEASEAASVDNLRSIEAQSLVRCDKVRNLVDLTFPKNPQGNPF